LRALPLVSRNLWSQTPSIHLQSNVLVRSRDDDDTKVQLVVPMSLRRRLFEHAHAGPLSAHLGADRTLAQLQQAYYWPAMRKDVHKWYKECPDCAESKGPITKPHEQLRKVFAGAPLDMVAIDVLVACKLFTTSHTRWHEIYLSSH